MHGMIMSQPQVGWLFQMYDPNLAALALVEAYTLVYDHMTPDDWAIYGQPSPAYLSMDRIQVLEMLGEMGSTAQLAYKEDCQCANGTYICPSCRGNLDMEGWFLDAVCHVLQHMTYNPELAARWAVSGRVEINAVDPASVSVVFYGYGS